MLIKILMFVLLVAALGSLFQSKEDNLDKKVFDEVESIRKGISKWSDDFFKEEVENGAVTKEIVPLANNVDQTGVYRIINLSSPECEELECTIWVGAEVCVFDFEGNKRMDTTVFKISLELKEPYLERETIFFAMGHDVKAVQRYRVVDTYTFPSLCLEF